MKDLLSVYGKAGALMLLLLGMISFAIVYVLLAAGDVLDETVYMIGLAMGYVAGMIFVYTLTNNVSKASKDYTQEVAAKIGSGGFVRIASLCIILGTAHFIGDDECFFMAIIGYFIFILLAFICLLVTRLRKIKHDGGTAARNKK
ncbi:MAG: hypothetical protein ACI4OA_03755 [Selenomonadaceae bacterium]